MVEVDGLPISDHASSLKMIVVETPATTINPGAVRNLQTVTVHCCNAQTSHVSHTFEGQSMRPMCIATPPHIYHCANAKGGESPTILECSRHRSNQLEIIVFSILPLPAPAKVLGGDRMHARVLTVPAS